MLPLWTSIAFDVKIKKLEHRVSNQRSDGFEGSQKIVVKFIGPQIGAIRWIAGASILGDGRVVLVLDVPTKLITDN